jgi:cardiolipin synthase
MLTKVNLLNSMVLKYLPNLFTIARFFLIAPFLIFFCQKNYTYALYIFLLAGFTDGLDGWCARQFDWQSSLGSMLDPIADKLLIVTSFISLAWVNQMPWWLIELVLFRDISILMGVFAWYHVMRRGLEFKPSWLSKLNTVIELLLVSYCLFELAFFHVSTPFKLCLIGAVAFTTTVSYVEYMWMWAKKAAVNHSNL